MALVSKTRTYASGDILTAQFYNEDRDEIIAGVNSITDAQIAGNAAIDLTKLAGGTLPSNIFITADNFPDGVTLTGAQVVSDKTLVKPTMNASVQNLTTDPDNDVVLFDLSASNVHTVTLEGNRTLDIANGVVGQPLLVRVIQDAFGSRTVNWWDTIIWTGGNPPTLSTTPDAIDVFGFICTATDGLDNYDWDGYYVSFDLK